MNSIRSTHMRVYLKGLAILLAVLLAGLLRWRAVQRLPIDYDENDYLRAGQQYAALLRSHDWAGFTQVNERPEHPPLNKIVFGVALLSVPEAQIVPERDPSQPPAEYLPPQQLRADRTASAIFGTLEVLLVALVNPLAGIFLGIHTFTIKYTSQVMLEALPAFTSFAGALCYLAAKKAKRGPTKQAQGLWAAWMAAAAFALGLTAASKYIYCVAGIAILVDWFRTSRREGSGFLKWFGMAMIWGMFALMVFFAAYPYLWPDPLGRLKDSILSLTAYSQGAHVQEAGYPVWQPLVWLTMSVPWHPGVFVVSLDVLISLLALIGARRLWQKEPFYIVWLGLGLVFLLLWPTKWPQYILILTAPLSLAAAEGVQGILASARAAWVRTAPGRQARPGKVVSKRETLTSIPWLLPGVAGLGLLVLFPLLFQLAMALTDFNGASIRDGIQGGVWRAVWQGILGQARAIDFDPFSAQGYSASSVHYAGPNLLLHILSGNGSSILIFDLLWMLLSVSLQAVLGIGLALMLDRRGVRLAGFWRTIFILPWAIPEFIGALIWLRTFQPEIGWLGMAIPAEALRSYLTRGAASPLLVLLIAATWFGFPFIMLAASAGLKLIPRELYDAAALDGAGGWQLFREITWPLLMPLVIPALILRSILAFNQFYLFNVMQTKFPMMTLANFSYLVFTRGNEYAASAAINIAAVAVLFVLLLLFNRLSRIGEGASYA